jgi:hypothetical protein
VTSDAPAAHQVVRLAAWARIAESVVDGVDGDFEAIGDERIYGEIDHGFS